MLRGIRYLTNVIVFVVAIISYYVVVGQLTPIHHSMVNKPPNGLACEFYNATITPRSPPPISWGCSRGDFFSEPLPTITAIIAVGTAFFVLRFTIQGLSTNYLPGLIALFLFITSSVASAIRVIFFIEGSANHLYLLWTTPPIFIFLFSKIYLNKPTKYTPPISKKERIRRHKIEISISIEIAERLKEREKNKGR